MARSAQLWGLEQDDADSLRAIILYLASVKHRKFFGKIQLSVQAGEVKDVREERNFKMDELPRE
jgi:hypothetical protein